MKRALCCKCQLQKAMFPYQFTHVGKEALEKISQNFHPDGNKSEYEIREIGFRMSKPIVTMAPRIYHMEVRPDDIWLVTFPKCGTMWTQEWISADFKHCTIFGIQ